MMPFVVVKKTRVAAGKDQLGNIKYEWQEKVVDVSGWALPTSDEQKYVGHERKLVEIEMYAEPGFFSGDLVSIPGRGWFQVVGDPEDYAHNPFGWNPGLEVVNLAKVTNDQ